MKLPDYPIPDEPIRASWGRVIVDYLRSITPRSSPSILVSTTANGSTFQPLVRAGAGGSMPFSGRVMMNQLPRITIDTAETGATKFLYMHSDGSHTWAAVMPDVQPADGVVFDLDQTAGDIHIIGNFAG